MLTGFSVENYRAFSRHQNIEIRPLTLFFGWNSGGKSALVRFLPLLAESIRAKATPIWLAGNVGRKATWSELVCKYTERTSLKFALKWDTDVAEWDIDADLDGRWQETRSLLFSEKGNVQKLSRLEVKEEQWTGLIPQIADTMNTKLIEQKLRDLAAQTQWMSGVRVSPPRVAIYGGGTLPTLCHNGSDAVDHLIAAQLRSSADPLLEIVRSFFSALGEQLTLDSPMSNSWRLLLHPISGSAKLGVNLCDTGEGYAQVLPVLVALARARTGGPRILCLEQPELHLHTSAQAELANLLVASAKDAAKPSILVETHSEVLLTSVQLALANGEISPDMVRVYWIESRPDGSSDAIPVDFDQWGRPSNTTLMGAFGEVVELGQELIMKQLSSAK